VAPGRGVDGHHVEVTVDDEGSARVVSFGMREIRDKGQPVGARLHRRPPGPAGGQGLSNQALDGPLVARRVAGVHRNEGSGQLDDPVSVHVISHVGEPKHVRGAPGKEGVVGRAAILDVAMDVSPLPEPDRRARRRRGDPECLLEAARAGDRGAIGRLLSMVERGGELGRQVGRLCFAPGEGAEQVVGITGAPGAGKSTLTDRLITTVRKNDERIGVLAVDPSSPYSGGAILGDRIRMQGHALDDGVFIRSMATRGHQGGLSLATPEAIRVLVASGIPLVLVETVGVGQVEVEIAGAADSTLVVVNPGWGDSVQANKAGLLEVADIFVVNKADRPGARETARDLENMLDLNPSMGEWRPPVLLTSGPTGEGVEELWQAVLTHRDHLLSSGEMVARRRRRLLAELQRVLTWRIEREVRALESGSRWEAVKDELLARRVDPYDAAERLLAPG
jgi:LAO/AO transport system kinase